MKMTSVRKTGLLVISWLPFLLAVVILLKTLEGLFHSRYSADDYCFDSLVERSGFINGVQYLLNNSGPYFFAYSIQLGAIGLKISPGFFLSILFLILVFSVQALLKELIQVEKKESFHINSYTTLIALFLISSLISLPADGPGSFFSTTIGWSAGTSRLIALIFLINLLHEIMKPSPKVYKLALFAIIVSGTDFAIAMVISITLFIIWISSFREFGKVILRSPKILILSIFIFLLNVLLTQTNGSKNRVLALNEGMRQGKSIGLDNSTYLTAKYNAYRLLTESISLKAFLIALLIGFLLFLRDKLAPITEKRILVNRRYTAILMILLTLFIWVFTWMGSIVAYLQTWHFIAYVFVLYFTISLVTREILNLTPAIHKIVLSSRVNHFISSALVCLLFLNSYMEVARFSFVSNQRSVAFDVRHEKGILIDVPIRDFNGKALTEDIKSEWVKSCFLVSQDN